MNMMIEWRINRMMLLCSNSIPWDKKEFEKLENEIFWLMECK